MNTHVYPGAARGLLSDVEKLTGLEGDRVNDARAQVGALGIGHLTRELLGNETVDTVVGSVLLAESMQDLVVRGVDRTKLVAKLRRDPDVWPTWAELRAAAQLAHWMEDDGELVLEAGRRAGRHPDFQFSRSNGQIFQFIPSGSAKRLAVEFKAVGLSDAETEFCRRARPTLRAVRPQRGFVTLHAPLEMKRQGSWVTLEVREHMQREAARLADSLPDHAEGLSGISVVAQGSEASYVTRLRDRFQDAFDQIPAQQESWIAFHWSNGAPPELIAEALDLVNRPPNVVGIAFIGSAIAFPHPEIHNFLVWGLMGQSGVSDGPAFHSSVDEEGARLVFDRVNRSSGVRAIVVRGERDTGTQDIVVRDGSRRILPSVLLIDPDPSPKTHHGIPIGGSEVPSTWMNWPGRR